MAKKIVEGQSTELETNLELDQNPQETGENGGGEIDLTQGKEPDIDLSVPLSQAEVIATAGSMIWYAKSELAKPKESTYFAGRTLKYAKDFAGFNRIVVCDDSGLYHSTVDNTNPQAPTASVEAALVGRVIPRTHPTKWCVRGAKMAAVIPTVVEEPKEEAKAA